MRGPRQGARSISGFTLVELMVSISVLAVLGGLVAQLMSSTSRLTSSSKQASECDTEARYALNQISADLMRRVRRSDVDAFVKKMLGNDQFFFFSETAGYAPTLTDERDTNRPVNRSNVSLVGYRVKKVERNGMPFWELQRYARALPWTTTGDDKALPFVVLSGVPAMPLPSSTLAGTDGEGAGGTFPNPIAGDESEDIYFQPIAQNVIRFEISVLLKPDTSDPAVPVPARLLRDTQINTELSRNGFSNISSIVVSLAVLDSQSAAKLRPSEIDAVHISDLRLLDSNPDEFPKYPVDSWNTDFKDRVSSLPRYIAAGIHFYQRVISL